MTAAVIPVPVEMTIAAIQRMPAHRCRPAGPEPTRSLELVPWKPVRLEIEFQCLLHETLNGIRHDWSIDKYLSYIRSRYAIFDAAHSPSLLGRFNASHKVRHDKLTKPTELHTKTAECRASPLMALLWQTQGDQALNRNATDTEKLLQHQTVYSAFNT
ncbi:hypothetical protein BIT28_16120 [Photobacterium proteolyticum]|uniref:Uncharacterized protein n=1 Tax=Photobacterium proteolyticum TaxID=1903952 RepID=A0A1Q9H1Y1_9GAMM|nr:hypothetical protein BIT28_16120 [Photobacterium proteolyticum]